MADVRSHATVVYLTKNGGSDFLRSLELVRTQKAVFHYDVLVIDSGSTDGTIEEAEESGVRVVRIPPEEFNYGGTKNLAARLARGEILVFLSQDNIPSSREWLATLLSHFRNNVDAVQGHSISEANGYYWWVAGGFFYTRETRRWIREHGLGLSCCNLAIRRDVLLRLPFREVPMNEDKVLQKDLLSAGAVIVEAVDAPVYHTHSYGFRTLAQRLKNEGLGWRYAGATYTVVDMVLDMASPTMWTRLVRAASSGELRGLPELLFPIVRPLMVYKGLHFATAYVWEKETAAKPRSRARDLRNKGFR